MPKRKTQVFEILLEEHRVILQLLEGLVNSETLNENPLRRERLQILKDVTDAIRLHFEFEERELYPKLLGPIRAIQTERKETL